MALLQWLLQLDQCNSSSNSSSCHATRACAWQAPLTTALRHFSRVLNHVLWVYLRAACALPIGRHCQTVCFDSIDWHFVCPSDSIHACMLLPPCRCLTASIDHVSNRSGPFAEPLEAVLGLQGLFVAAAATLCLLLTQTAGVQALDCLRCRAYLSHRMRDTMTLPGWSQLPLVVMGGV